MNRMHFDRSNLTTTFAVAVAAFGVGAAIMYILDPESGRRRRAYARDRTLDAANDMVDTVKDTARGLRDRAQGTIAEVGETARSLRNRAQDTATDVKDTARDLRIRAQDTAAEVKNEFSSTHPTSKL